MLSSCLAAAGLLAFVWLSKFGDHLPFYRQVTITRRFGIPLARSTLCHRMIDLAQAWQEPYQVMIAEVLRSRAIHTDDTTVSAWTRGCGHHTRGCGRRVATP
ncbi:MAG: IS66 family transposase [Pirellulaceae bacterium]